MYLTELLRLSVIRFLFGVIIGSFLNVVSLRYDEQKFLFARRVIGGRSHCPQCKKTLRWFELVPLLSFIIQRGKCRTCKAKISWQYPFVELTTGLLFLFVPFGISGFTLSPKFYILNSIFWMLTFSLLLLMSLIDLRLKLIPDEIAIALFVIGIMITAIGIPMFSLTGGSFLGPYGVLLGMRGNIWFNHLFGGFALGLAFFVLSLSTGWRGMGLGDVKLIFALGFLFGWPDILLIAALAFVIGSIVGIFVLLTKRGTRKSTLPFGPFLALASLIIFFFGESIVRGYFSLFSIT